MTKIKIPVKVPTLNEFLSASHIQRGSWNAGNKIKQDCQKELYYYLCKLPVFTKPLILHFTWIEKNKRRDLDNISAVGKKFILDTLQLCGKIKNDNLNYIVGFTDKVIFDKECGVIIEFEEIENENNRKKCTRNRVCCLAK